MPSPLCEDLEIRLTENYILEAVSRSERIRRVHEAARSASPAVKVWARRRFRHFLKMTGFEEPEATQS